MYKRVGPKVSGLTYKNHAKWKMLRGIYSAIYGETILKNSKFIYIYIYILKNSKVVLFLSPLKVCHAGNFWAHLHILVYLAKSLTDLSI
jgi:hypothetical protein